MSPMYQAVACIKQMYLKKQRCCVLKKNRDVMRLTAALKDMGFISGITFSSNHIIAHLRYRKNKPGIRKLGLLSKPSNPVYLKRTQINGRNLIGYYKNTGAILFRNSYADRFITDAECFLLGLGGEPVLVVA